MWGRLSGGAGIKMEGLLYFEKYGIGGPEFGIKEEFVAEYARAWTGRLVVYSSANSVTGATECWNGRSFGQWLHTGKETTTAPHDRTKTQHQRTIDWTKNILIFSTSKLTKTISPTVWLKLKVDFF